MRSPHTSYRWRGERVIETIKCLRSPHTSYRWRGERDRANQVYALTTHQLQVERRERHRANQVSALTTHQLQVERRESQSSVCTHHTPATGGEERESIKCLRSPHTSYRWRGERVNQVYALTIHQLQVDRREIESQSSVCSHHTPATGGEERDREPIKCMLSPHTSYRCRGERDRANQVYALTTHQLQVERRER